MIRIRKKQSHIRVLVMMTIGRELAKKGLSTEIITQGIRLGDIGKLYEFLFNDTDYGYIGLKPGGGAFEAIYKTLRQRFPAILHLVNSRVSDENYDAWIARVAEQNFKGDLYVTIEPATTVRHHNVGGFAMVSGSLKDLGERFKRQAQSST